MQIARSPVGWSRFVDDYKCNKKDSGTSPEVEKLIRIILSRERCHHPPRLMVNLLESIGWFFFLDHDLFVPLSWRDAKTQPSSLLTMLHQPWQPQPWHPAATGHCAREEIEEMEVMAKRRELCLEAE